MIRISVPVDYGAGVMKHFSAAPWSIGATDEDAVSMMAGTILQERRDFIVMMASTAAQRLFYLPAHGRA